MRAPLSPPSPNDTDGVPLPLVFFHGLGLGLFPYLYFVRRLQRECARPILLIDLPHISITMLNFFPQRDSPTVPRTDFFVFGGVEALYDCICVFVTMATRMGGWKWLPLKNISESGFPFRVSHTF